MLRWVDDKFQKDQILDVQFSLRTFRHPAVVLFVELTSRRNSSSGMNYGSIEVMADRQADRQAGRLVDRQADRQADRLVDRQADW